MKRLFAVLLVGLVTLMITACTEGGRAMKKCRSCDGLISKTASYCEHCGAFVKDTQENTNPSEGENGPVHTHLYSDATCTEPARCSCGATEGSALGHRFTEATCTAPEICQVCGATEGTAAEHSYDLSGTCKECGDVLPEAREYIAFTDIFLENNVKQALGLEGTQKVSKYAMSRLTSLGIREGVTDVQDLQYAVNLQRITIEANNVKNLEVLCGIPTITYVQLGFGKEIDISFMKDMTAVESVSFGNAEIVGGELSYLVASPVLKDLYFYYTGSEGIGFLKDAQALETLEIWHAIGWEEDISVLTTLPKLKDLELVTFQTLPDAHKAVYAKLLEKGVSVRFI